MNYNTRSKSLQRLDHEVGLWISYQLKRKGKTHADVAAIAGVRQNTVDRVLLGIRTSPAVYPALCTVLGYGSIRELLDAAKRSAV